MEPVNTRTLRPLMVSQELCTSPLLDGVQGPALGAMQEPIPDFMFLLPIGKNSHISCHKTRNQTIKMVPLDAKLQ